MQSCIQAFKELLKAIMGVQVVEMPMEPGQLTQICFACFTPGGPALLVSAPEAADAMQARAGLTKSRN